MWHHNEGVAHKPYPAVEVYDNFARELRIVNIDPTDASLHDMITDNMSTASRNRVVQMVVYLLRSMADAIEREGTIRATAPTLHTRKH